MTLRTSLSHPLRVDWLPTALPGRIGLTLAPGKKGASKTSGGTWVRDLTLDLEQLVTVHKAHDLVSLIEDHELVTWGIGDLYGAAAARDLVVHRLPIGDVGTPNLLTPVRDLVVRIVEGAKNGRTIVIHCIGGLGRSGTIAGCVLVQLGVHPDEALHILHRVRDPHCPETPEQEAFIRRYLPV